MKITEFLGVDIAFSVPEWFPPESEDYETPGTDWREKYYSNHAVDALLKLPDIGQYARNQICGDYVVFHFEGISTSLIPTMVKEHENLVRGFFKMWRKPIEGHEYLIQTSSFRGEFEVLDLSSSPPGMVVFGSMDYLECQRWIDG